MREAEANCNDERVQVWRWRLMQPGPSLLLTLPVMEAIKGAVSHVSYRGGVGRLPDEVHGGLGTDHTHAFWLPEDDDQDGLIDHIAVFARTGIEEIVPLLANVTWFRLGDDRYSLKPSWMGPRPEGGMFGPASVWVSLTPYVTPKWRLTKTGKERAQFTPDSQLLDEIQSRGFAKPLSTEWLPTTWCGDDMRLASQFEVMRRAKGGPPGDAVGSFARIQFPEPVEGPLAFGFGAHFGLGLMMPVDS